MGMFDYITCAMPLPDCDLPTDTVFQTKDTGAQFMETYRIEADGRLIHEAVDYRFLDPDVVNPGKTGFAKLAGTMARENQRDEVVPYHGDIEFYHYQNGVSHEFVARFTEGICVRIWRVKEN